MLRRHLYVMYAHDAVISHLLSLKIDAFPLLAMSVEALGRASAACPTHTPFPLSPIFVFVGSRPARFTAARVALLPW